MQRVHYGSILAHRHADRYGRAGGHGQADA
jgi:hypothetical protein